MSGRLKIAVLLIVATGLAGAAQAQNEADGRPQGGMMANMIQMIDTDHDGKISLDEYTGFSQMRWQRLSGGADKVKLADLRPMQQRLFAGLTPDADGMISKDAFLASIPARFKAIDTNGDGSLDQAELMAAMPMRHRPD